MLILEIKFGYSFMVIFLTLLFLSRARERSTYMHDLTVREKQMSDAMI